MLLGGGKKRIESLSNKLLLEQKEQKFNITKTVRFTRGREHGLKLEDDSSTVKKVADGSQAHEEGVVAGWTIIRVESNGSMITKGFHDILNDTSREIEVLFGIPKSFEEQKEQESRTLDVNIRFIVTRLCNCCIINETFEADLFIELMWLAPWDVPV